MQKAWEELLKAEPKMSDAKAIKIISDIVLREINHLMGHAEYHEGQLPEPDYDHKTKAIKLRLQARKTANAMECILVRLVKNRGQKNGN